MRKRKRNEENENVKNEDKKIKENNTTNKNEENNKKERTKKRKRADRNNNNMIINVNSKMLVTEAERKAKQSIPITVQNQIFRPKNKNNNQYFYSLCLIKLIN